LEIFNTGLRIEHSQALYPEFILFFPSYFPWASGFEKLKSDLTRLDNNVED